MPYDAATYVVDPLSLTTGKDRLRYLRDYLAALPEERFNMFSYFGWFVEGWFNDRPAKLTNAAMLEGSCKTAACIAGHTLAVFRPNDVREYPVEEAGLLLGVGVDAAERLFEPNNHDEYFMREELSLLDVTRARALLVIDHLIQTDKVDWRVAYREGEWLA